MFPGPIKGTLFRFRRLFARLLRYQCRSGRFGFVEAIVFCFSVDLWRRYAAASGEIRALREIRSGPRLRILDVGGGAGDIALFLSPGNYHICVLDTREEELRRWRDTRVDYVVGSGTHLPFGDATFDVVTSIDCLEHVPAPLRPSFIAQLLRVARKRLIIHVPARSDDSVFVAPELDLRLAKWFRRLYRVEEPNIREHLEMGVPSLDELRTWIPGSRVVGLMNARAWLQVMVLERAPLLMFVAGLAYWLWIRRRDVGPPFYGCLLVWDRDGPPRLEN